MSQGCHNLDHLQQRPASPTLGSAAACVSWQPVQSSCTHVRWSELPFLVLSMTAISSRVYISGAC